MTDLEIIRLCAEAINLGAEIDENGCYYDSEGSYRGYWPLTKDEQAMALVKRLGLQINATLVNPFLWCVNDVNENFSAESENLNRAICECVAKMQANSAT